MNQRFRLSLVTAASIAVAFSSLALAREPSSAPGQQTRYRRAAHTATDLPLSPQHLAQTTPMPRLLTAPEIKTQAATLPGWTVEGKRLRCERVFKGFPEAVAFVQALVEPAESAGHHPDLKVSYNRVVVELTTHDAGGLTQQDFDLAKVISCLR